MFTPQVFNRETDYPLNQYFDTPGDRVPKGFFYRIYDTQGQEVGRLLGTLHVASREMLRLNGAMRESLEKASAIYLEIEASSPGNLQFPSIPKTPQLDEGKKEKIDRFISSVAPKILQKLEESSNSFMLPVFKGLLEDKNNENRYRMTLGLITQLSCKEAKIANLGIDNLLLHMGRELQKRIHGLEKNDIERDQMLEEMMEVMYTDSFIDSLPTNDSEADSYLFRRYNEITLQFKAWVEGDADEVLKYNEDKMCPNFERIAEKRETEQMVPEIHQALLSRKEGEMPLFAVGAAHFVHPGNNVIKQLQERGWKIVRD